MKRNKFTLIRDNDKLIVKFAPEYKTKGTHPYLSVERLNAWGFNFATTSMIDVHQQFICHGDEIADVKAVQFQSTGKADTGMIAPGLPATHRVIKDAPASTEYDAVNVIAVNPCTGRYNVVQTIKQPLR